MLLPDNSDSACLIKADWLEDHDQAAEAQELREEVAEDLYVCVDDFGGVGDFGGFGGVGGDVGVFSSEVGGGLGDGDEVGRVDGVGVIGGGVFGGGVFGGGVGGVGGFGDQVSIGIGVVDGRWRR